MDYRFLGNIIITGKIKCLTALHIGGMVEGYEIGGMDNPIIKNPVDGYPYIPGSSLKGKMRSLLEWSKGLIQVKEEENNETSESTKKKKEIGEVHSCGKPDCIVCRIFGAAAEEERKIGPTRLMIRDAHPTEATKKMLDRLQAEKGLPKAEWKTENVLNRITAKAIPRTIERVPKDSQFELEMVYSIYQVGNENNLIDLVNIQYLFEAMHLLEDSSLGGYGSRGSGKIQFDINKIKVKTSKDYEEGTDGMDVVMDFRKFGSDKFEEIKKILGNKK
ncbi:MAG: type III-A CRISPR-associated RAMP protein Csm3 [candidate division WOR-3 bacterium]